ncbi:MAG: rod shape-determining protein MreC [Sedimentisphaeraceae bacterium JB056]
MVSIAILILPHQITNNLNSFFIELFSPVISLRIDLPEELLSSQSPGSEWVSRQEYNRLWAAYKNIYADLLEEHERLEKMAKYRSYLPKSGAGLVAAKIIRKEQGHFLLISRGALDGVRAGQYVMSDGVVIGTVSEVSTATARVTLVVNNSHSLEVRIMRDNANDYIRANIKGDGVNAFKIPLVSREFDIKPGDLVYASPDPRYLDTPRYVGEIKVVQADKENPLLWDISGYQPIDYDKLEEVAVVVMETVMEGSQ